MPAFTLSPNTWTQIVAPGGSRDQQVQITSGRALINFGAVDASASPISAGTTENKFFIVPAGTEVQARASGPSATVTTGDC